MSHWLGHKALKISRDDDDTHQLEIQMRTFIGVYYRLLDLILHSNVEPLLYCAMIPISVPYDTRHNIMMA